MAEIKWIKIVTDIFDNRKVKQIEALPDADSILVIWFKLICLAGSINDGGRIYFLENVPYTDEMLATQFRRPLNTVRMALETFRQFGMIEIIDDILCLPSWEKYQSADKLEQIRERNRLRQAKFKAKQKALPGNVTDNVTVTPGNATDIEEDREEDREGEGDEKKPAGKPPAPAPTEQVDFGALSPRAIAAVKKWLKYKKERREGYKPTGLTALITQIEKNVKRYGEDAVIDLIGECMAANWQGIIFDKLKNRPQKPQPPQQQKSGGDRLLEMIRRGDFDDE